MAAVQHPPRPPRSTMAQPVHSATLRVVPGGLVFTEVAAAARPRARPRPASIRQLPRLVLLGGTAGSVSLAAAQAASLRRRRAAPRAAAPSTSRPARKAAVVAPWALGRLVTALASA